MNPAPTRRLAHVHQVELLAAALPGQQLRRREGRNLGGRHGHRSGAGARVDGQGAQLAGAAGRAARILLDLHRPERGPSTSTRRSRPTSGVPAPVSHLSTSVAWMSPTRPGTTPSTPPSAQDGTRSGGGAARDRGSGSRGRPGRRRPTPAPRAEDRTVEVRPAGQHAGVVDQVPRGEVVGPVHHQVVGPRQLQGVAGVEPGVVRLDPDAGVEVRSRSRADSSFFRPTSRVPCSTWRCRLVASTRSASTMPRVPTPAAAGRARPPSRGRPRRPSAPARP